ncbi:DUF4365 domain-containing protein [Streptomyces sp. NPDC005727]|uniref:DUF4365 domain-containing protein n=1 Tax=Streptomyces sp. NPDC005727 TaxID=3157053 RepID=UPI0033FAC7F9
MGVDVTSSTVAGSTALEALFPHSPSTSILAIKRRGGVRVAGGATSWQKEQIGRAYVHAIASQGGYTVGDWNVDKDGVDVTLRDRGLMVDIQLKCTESPRTVRGGYSFDLDIETYNKLRSTERSAPGHLVLLVVPPNLELWVTQHQDSVVLACHWVLGMPARSGGGEQQRHYSDQPAARTAADGEVHALHVRHGAEHSPVRQHGGELTWPPTNSPSGLTRSGVTSRSLAGPRSPAATWRSSGACRDRLRKSCSYP